MATKLEEPKAYSYSVRFMEKMFHIHIVDYAPRSYVVWVGSGAGTVQNYVCGVNFAEVRSSIHSSGV
jgi:hypothetical protein